VETITEHEEEKRRERQSRSLSRHSCLWVGSIAGSRMEGSNGRVDSDPVGGLASADKSVNQWRVFFLSYLKIVISFPSVPPPPFCRKIIPTNLPSSQAHSTSIPSGLGIILVAFETC
jgi:hypothetical protein